MKKPSLMLAGILSVLFCLQASDGKQKGLGSLYRPSGVLAPSSTRIDADFGKLPLQFIPNQGQMDGQVAYYVQGRDKTIYFTPEGLTFVLAEQTQKDGKKQPGPGEGNGLEPTQRWVVKLDFVDSNTDVKPVGLEESGAVVSYFKGNPEEWKTGLPAYSKILYRDLWPGIDLLYYGTFNRMKYEFIVHPGADPFLIRLAYRGAESVALTAEGRLEAKTSNGGIEDDIPVAYQEADGKQENVPVAYALASEAETESRTYVYGFKVGKYDRSRTLVLDPAVLIYCGYIGGSGPTYSRGIAVDGSGNAYITGDTGSTETTFPVIVGPELIHKGGADVFVAKVNASGTALVYCGYIGGSGPDSGGGIAVDGLGNAYVMGFTSSTEETFPVTGGPDLTPNGDWDAFVCKVNASGTALVYCGYIGGSAEEYGRGIAVDSSGNAYVTGETLSTEATFPVTVGPDLTSNGERDAFIAKVNASGTALVYCGYIGGSGNDWGFGIAVDNSGNAYVTGLTMSTESSFPVTVGPDLTSNGERDAFIAKVNASGSALVYCGILGGSKYDDGYGVAVDGPGNAYVIGYTASNESTFPVVGGPDLTYNGGSLDAFVAKVNSAGTALDYCGYIGGAGLDYGVGIAVDGSGNAYVIGSTVSMENTFPVVGGPDLSYNGGVNYGDYFVAKVNATGSALFYCGYIGGSDDEGAEPGGIAVDGSGNAYITGWSASDEYTFPVIVGPDLTHNGTRDTFVAKIQIAPPSLTSLLPSSATACDPGFTLSVIGSDFANGAVVRWDGSNRPTTYVNSLKLEAQIATADLTTGRIVQVTVLNPDGGISSALDFSVAGFTISSTPTSATVTAGQSATYTIQVMPQYGPFNSSLSFSCTGLPSKCTASFLPTSVTPGANVVTTMLTLTTQAASGSTGGAIFRSTGFVPPALGLLLIILALFIWDRFREPVLNKHFRRWLTAGALVCLIVLVVSCSAGGDGNPPITGTPPGTYQVSVRGQSSCLTVSTTVTLIVR
jgi:hypothetical protein